MKNSLLLFNILIPKGAFPRGAKGENLICLEIASYLREQSLEREFPFVWFHVPNQYCGTYKGVFGSLLSWMGRISGVPDYAFMGKKECFFIEVKTEKGIQSQNQKIFQTWCESKKVSYHICKSCEEVKILLKNKAT